MNQYNLMFSADFYKVSHKAQYPDDVTRVHSTLVARGANYNDFISKTEFQWFGLKLFIDKLHSFSDWLSYLTQEDMEIELEEYKKFLDTRLGGDNSVDHWRELWFYVNSNGELPLEINAQPERTIQKFQTPLVTVENTVNKFAWLTSYIETSMLANVWGVTTAANRAYHIRQNILSYMEGYTAEELMAVDFMAHDFSYRGILGDEGATITGCGHLANFKGSDNIVAIKAMQDIYGEVTGFSVPATEHSVVCSYGKASEEEFYGKLMDTYPEGIVSSVSDTYDYFNTLTVILPRLKSRIMERNGKFVVRPDSGDPVKIICGDPDAPVMSPEWEGSLTILDDIFGHTLDSKGLKVLDSHIGLIYGDGMNQERIDKMLSAMVAQGYSPLNMVFGVGAFTYQFMTRDELGFAFKATAVKRGGRWVDIQKNPKTDSSKKSLTGRFDLPEKVYG